MSSHSLTTIVGTILVACVRLSPMVSAQDVGRLPVELARAFTGAMFTDPNRGYVFADGSQAAIIATEDAGATWRLVLDFPVNGSKGSPASTFVLSADRFWVLTDSGTLYRTDDAGRTFDITKPKFVDAQTGTAVSVCRSLFFRTEADGWVICRCPQRTTDGGKTWHAVLVPDGLGSINAVWMFGESEGIAVTDRSPEGVVRTADGGKSWTIVANSPHLSQLSCTRDGFCAGLSSQYGPVVVSRDRGMTWQDAHIPLLQGRQDRINRIHAVGASTVLAVGTDVGYPDWELRRYIGTGTPAPLSETHGLVFKWDGASWKRLVHAEPREFAGVYFVDTNNGWLTGYENAIYKTTDGGQTLQFVPDYFRQIAALTPTEPPLPPEPTPTPGP